MKNLRFQGIGAALAVTLLATACAPIPSADQDCTSRFGLTGPDYWQCMAYLERREARIDALMSEARASSRIINPYDLMPPTVYVTHY